MAKLARDYHEGLQEQGIDPHQSSADYEEELIEALREIPQDQKLLDHPERDENWKITPELVEKALHLSKNGSAPGMDGCTYKLWKTIKERNDKSTKAGKRGFDIIKVLTIIFQDIQEHGVDERSGFS
ncbi:hypothetical protein EDB83DRAFT_2205946, partial [Lactarius deliciosus]